MVVSRLRAALEEERQALLGQAEALRLAIDDEHDYRGRVARPAPSLTSLIDTAVAIKCFGVGTSYFIVCGDLVPVALEGMGLRGELLLNRHFCIAICFVFGGIALMLQRSPTLTLTLT